MTTPPHGQRQAGELQRLTGLIVNQVSHWTAARWGARGDALHRTVQRIAGPAHAVPWLGPTALADQLRVVVADLIEAGDDGAISAAIKDLQSLRGTLKAAQ